MSDRTKSGLIILVIILAAGFTGKWTLFFLMLFCSLNATFEYFSAVGLSEKKGMLKNPLYIITAVMCIVYYTALFLCGVINIIPETFIDTMAVTGIFMFLSALTYMAVYVFAFPKYNLEQIIKALFCFIYTCVMMSTIFLCYIVKDIGFHLFWLVFVSTSICDVCAYEVGSKIGKHKIAPVLSPKKSLEGCIGGVLGSVLVAFLYGYFLAHKLLGYEDYSIIFMCICLPASIVSMIGDLAASAIKRNNDIKDYSNLIPGHGGILDRLDSCIFTAPIILLFAYFYLKLI